MNTDEIKTCEAGTLPMLFMWANGKIPSNKPEYQDLMGKTIFINTTSDEHLPVFEEVTGARGSIDDVNVLILTGINKFRFSVPRRTLIEYVIR